MRAFLGIWSLLAAVAVAYYFQADAPVDHEQQVAAVTRIIAEGPLDRPVETQVPAEPATDAGAGPGLPPVAARVAAATWPAGSAEVETVPAPWDTSVAAIGLPPSPPDPTPTAAPAENDKSAAEIQLARDIQKELLRLGCYSNKPSGVWGEGSRQAMARFLSRVNAKLPVNEPDLILLSLAQAHPAGICDQDCGAGETLASGRCVPKTVVASARPADAALLNASETPHQRAEAAHERRPKSEQRLASVEAVTVPRPRLEGRMSIGGPVATENLPAEVLPWHAQGSGSDPFAAESSDSKATVAVPATRPAKVQWAAIPPREPATSIEPEATRPSGQLATPSTPSPAKAQNRPRRQKTATKVSGTKKRPAGSNYANRNGSYRSVQSLFLHPLGRM